ncbi:hypothetical protein AB0C77_23470 [Streptomyces sp. NPDC048629]|uniref:hypothetical protein n=1 Tax=Streptomyces sp. NPDC048629 TaxID=3154824 RepID=UPI003423105F
MLSERRRARIRAEEGHTEGIPDELWAFPLNKWASARRAAGLDVDLGRFVQERDEWQTWRDSRLSQHGVSAEEFEKMQGAWWASKAHQAERGDECQTQ